MAHMQGVESKSPEPREYMQSLGYGVAQVLTSMAMPMLGNLMGGASVGVLNSIVFADCR